MASPSARAPRSAVCVLFAVSLRWRSVGRGRLQYRQFCLQPVPPPAVCREGKQFSWYSSELLAETPVIKRLIREK